MAEILRHADILRSIVCFVNIVLSGRNGAFMKSAV